MKDIKTPYYYLSKYRTELMGFAIIWITWFHSYFSIVLPFGAKINGILDIIKNFGYGGVDIFLLVSGLGIYGSLMKNDMPTFAKNRLKKILPIWYTCLVVRVLLAAFILKEPFTKLEIAGFATFTGYWLGMKNQSNWYLYAIMLFYVISPFLAALLRDSKNKTKTCLLMVCVSLAISVPFFGQPTLKAVSRLPIYIIGMYFTAELNNRPMDRKKWIACAAAFALGFAALLFAYLRLGSYYEPYALCWYPFIVIAPTMSLLIGKFLDRFYKATGALRFVLKKFGKASLEIMLATRLVFYNTNLFEFGFIPKRFTPFTNMVIGIILGFLFHIAVEFGKKCCGKAWSKIHKTA